MNKLTIEEINCCQALLADEERGCSKEHLDKYLESINATRQDLFYCLNPHLFQEQSGSRMLMA